MEKREAVLRIIAFSFLVLIVYPIAILPYMPGESISQRLDNIFHTQNTIKAFFIAFVIFCFLSFERFLNSGRYVTKTNTRRRKRKKALEIASLCAAGLALFFIVASTVLPIDEGIANGNYVPRDLRLYLDAVPAVGETLPLRGREIVNSSVRKYLDFSSIPDVDDGGDPDRETDGYVIGIYGRADPYIIGDGKSKFYLGINDAKYDITENIIDMSDGGFKLYRFRIRNGKIVNGTNTVTFYALGENTRFEIAERYYFVNGDSAREFPLGYLVTDGEMMITIFEEHDNFYGLINAFRPVMQIMLFMVMFMIVFGLWNSVSLIRSSRLEAVWAVIGGSFFIYMLSAGKNEIWPIAAKSATWVAGMLAKVTIPGANFDISRLPPTIGSGNAQFAVNASCSGFDSISLFALLFFLIIFPNWKKIDKKWAGALFAIGLLLLIVVNGIRIYLLLLIAVLFSLELSVNLFHTNAGWVFFLLYGLLFWLIAFRFILRKGP